MKKRVLSLILCLVMALSLIPSMAFAETYPETIWVRNSNGQHIPIHGGQCLKTNTAEDAVDYHGGADYVVMYKSAKGELHLRGFQGKIENSNENAATSVIDIRGDCTIIVEQDSMLTIDQNDPVTRDTRYGIYAGGALTIIGSGKLTVNINNNSTAYGIYAENGMTVHAAMEMNDNNPSSGSFYGLYAWSGEIMLNGEAKTIRLNANEGYPYAIYNLAYDADVTGNGNITVKCPLTITNSGDNGANGSGIVTGQSSYNANGVITLDGADVSISGLSQDIWDGSMERTGADGIVIKDSKLSVSATAADSNAIRSVYNNVSVLNSTVTASSDASAIRAGAVSIKDSEVDLTANTLGGASRVIYTYDNAVNTVDLSGSGFVKLTFIGEQEFSLISGKVVVGKDTACTKGVYDTDWENYHGVAEGGNTVTVFAHKTSSAPTLDDLKFTVDPSSDIVFLTNRAAHDGVKIYVKNMSSENISFVAGCGESDFIADGSFIGPGYAMLTSGQETYFTVKLSPTKNNYASGTVSIYVHITNYPGIKKTVTIPVKYDSNVAFTTQPVSGNAGLGEEYTFQWATSPTLSTCMLQKQVGSGFIDEKQITSTTATVPASSFATTSTYRLKVAFDGVYSYSNEFTVTWKDNTVKRFTTQPVGGTVKNGQQYPVTWALSFEPDYAYVEQYNTSAGTWIKVQNATATGTTLPDLENNGSVKLRVVAFKDGNPYYSNEFTVTWSDPVGSLLGDVNGDGKINALDVARLRQYVAKQTTDIVLANSDTTRDGKINALDVARLRQYVAKQISSL